jgi:hypothetical protein
MSNSCNTQKKFAALLRYLVHYKDAKEVFLGGTMRNIMKMSVYKFKVHAKSVKKNYLRGRKRSIVVSEQ